MMNHVMESCQIWNSYGPAEATLGSTYHLIDIVSDQSNIPIGTPFPNYKYLILDDHLQSVVLSQEGELFVGGVGVFGGYLGRDDLTAKALVEN